MKKLGVNIDHVATVREARKTVEPDPVWAAAVCELAGCHSIVAHLRVDRRHVKDRDLLILKETVRTRLNLEMSASKEIVDIACRVKPDQATLVPEKRRELTTEGGLDVAGSLKKLAGVIKRLKRKKITVSLFIDPEKKQIYAARESGADSIEIHTGMFANAGFLDEQEAEIKRIDEAVSYGRSLGLQVNAGHGLTYQNVTRVAEINGIEELNIGHSIISRAVFAGLEGAVKEMLRLIA